MNTRAREARAGSVRAPTRSSNIVVEFDQPQTISHLVYKVEETVRERTQEVRVEVSDDGGRTYRQILVQEYNFSPRGATYQREEQRLDLPGSPISVLLSFLTRADPARRVLRNYASSLKWPTRVPRHRIARLPAPACACRAAWGVEKPPTLPRPPGACGRG